jgi:hypothetical protein
MKWVFIHTSKKHKRSQRAKLIYTLTPFKYYPNDVAQIKRIKEPYFFGIFHRSREAYLFVFLKKISNFEKMTKILRGPFASFYFTSIVFLEEENAPK